MDKNKNPSNKSQVAKSISAPANGINFTIQKKDIVNQNLNQTHQLKENKTGLPDNLKSGIEHLSGIDISDVKVYYNSSQPAQLNAHAYAQGNQIHIAPGQEKHLAHEAWHVVQQKQGRVKPSKQLKGKVNINDNAALEKEADVMGSLALNIPSNQLQARNANSPFQFKPKPSKQIVQLQEIKTFGGSFNDVQYHITQKGATEGGKFTIGCLMNLSFHANDTVNCEKIGLVQTTTPTVKKFDQARENYAAARGLARSITDNVEGDHIDGARYFDRTDRNAHPVFGAQNPQNLPPDLMPESFHSEHDKVGAHVLNALGKVTKDEAAALLDEPGRDWREGWSVIQSFETAALCLTGPMKGEYLGSVEWGYHYGPDESGGVIPLRKISDGSPSLKFREASVRWNQAKIPQQHTDPIDTVKLPEEERIGNQEALSLPHRKFMLDQIQTLSQNSVLNLLEDPVFSTHSKQLLLNRLYILMSEDSFPSNWLNTFKRRATLRQFLIQLRDQYAAQHGWNVQEWSLDGSIRGLIGIKNGEQVKAKSLLRIVHRPAIFYCLNETFVPGTIINDGDHFHVSQNDLIQAAKDLG